VSDLAPGGGALGKYEARDLLDRARAVREHAYAPYSGFPVGAALLAGDGEVHVGANVENASYGLGICAEGSAVASAVSSGVRSFRAIAVAGPDRAGACLPCGSCRQILHEFAPDALVVVEGDGGEPRTIPLVKLLPEPFGPHRLRLTGGEGQ
jgi:cytidine deaminase